MNLKNFTFRQVNEWMNNNKYQIWMTWTFYILLKTLSEVFPVLFVLGWVVGLEIEKWFWNYQA